MDPERPVDDSPEEPATPPPKQRNRRAFIRREAKGVVLCRLDKFGMGKAIKGSLINLSQDGANLTLPHAVKVGHELSLEITGKGSGKSAIVRATVRKSLQLDETTWELGCQFEKRLSYEMIANLAR